MGHLPVRQQVDVSVVGEEALERAQVVAQFAVVAIAPRHVAMQGQLAGMRLRPGGIGVLPARAPRGIGAVNPQVDDVDAAQGRGLEPGAATQ